ncbi:uroporphyrinogen-III synthase [Nasonia vitripennis]|uniref:Uroporphyrinogen-III synthase n=1 Tax=Nasonia vitripennis TaxID=7425 RepID=A0A7M7G239_NASVI|nr:uroporphyrinogen-III synthase [Nasonia vitripennis]
MSINKIKVLLCTGVSSETDNNENQYKKCLTEHGFECEILQVLHFEFINLDDLRNTLLDSESYNGLILTSPRAAAAIAMTKMQNPFSLEPWLEKTTFCIGQATEFVAKEQVGLTNIFGSDSGNAKNLANFIVHTMKEKCKKPLLLPCSDIARDTIPQILLNNKIEVKKIVVYKTKAHHFLAEALNEALNQSPHVLVFYSPSIVDNMLNALSNNKTIFENFKIIAIGPVTEEALENAGIKVDGVAEKPEPTSLTEVIQKII